MLPSRTRCNYEPRRGVSVTRTTMAGIRFISAKTSKNPKTQPGSGGATRTSDFSRHDYGSAGAAQLGKVANCCHADLQAGPLTANDRAIAVGL